MNIQRKKDSLYFTLDSHPAFANALRRIMISDVPSIAIENVSITENSSVIIDEMIVHRLALIPLITNLDTINNFNYSNMCDCGDGCDKCSIIYSLNVVNDTDGVMSVLSDYLTSSRTDIIVNKDIEITRLAPGQSVNLKARAVKGRGKMHSKWSVSAGSSYHFEQKITGTEGVDIEELIEACPTGVFSASGIDSSKCISCDSCKPFGVLVEPNESKIFFRVETTGVLTPEELVISSCEILENILQTFLRDIT